MKQGRFSDVQIMGILREAESGISVPLICREHGISRSTFYKWRSKYGGLDVSQLSRLKELESENARLKRLYAELHLQNDVIKEALAKKW